MYFSFYKMYIVFLIAFCLQFLGILDVTRIWSYSNVDLRAISNIIIIMISLSFPLASPPPFFRPSSVSFYEQRRKDGVVAALKKTSKYQGGFP